MTPTRELHDTSEPTGSHSPPPEPGRPGLEDGPVLLYDGVCGFCDGTVRLLLRIDRHRVFRFAPLQGDFASGVRERHAELKGVDSIVLVEAPADSEESVYVRTDALLRVIRTLGGPWRLLGITGLIPRRLRDGLYDVFARHRYRVFGTFDTCPIPAPDVRSRFLD